MQTLHRARDRLVGERTALINQLRAVLFERGIIVAQGRRKLERQLTVMGTQVEALSQRMRMLIQDMRAQWYELDRRIAEFDKELADWARDDEAARRLRTIPGIGVLNATALVAAIGHCQCRSDFPQKCRSKIPQFGGHGDQPFARSAPPFFGGRPRRRRVGGIDAGWMLDFDRMCSGTRSACSRSR